LALAIVFLFGGAAAIPAEAQNSLDLGQHKKIDLSRLVVVGDSLSAGFQSDSLLDTAQPHGWAALVAGHANVPLLLPLIGPPGIPNVLELVSPGPPPIIVPASGMSNGREDPFLQVTDLAVPGAEVHDALSTRPSFPIDDLTDLILGLPGLLGGVSRTQVEWAQALEPTTIFVWLGSNDVLGGASAVDLSLITPPAAFAKQYDELLDGLKATNATIVVANITDVTKIPFFTSAEEIAAEAGLPLAIIGPILGIGPGDLVTPEGIALIPGILDNSSPGPLPANVVLTAKQAQQVREIVDTYNIIIHFEAAAHGAKVVDIHRLAAQLSENGIVVNGQLLTNQFLGGLFSLDGVHPTNTAYALLANQFIGVLNEDFNAGIPLVDVSKVASSDPLIPPFTAAAATLDSHVTAETAKSIKRLFTHSAAH
jgi:lysophospholipase L1-like esterase